MDAPHTTVRAATVQPHERSTPEEADATSNPRVRVATGLDVAAMGKLMTQPTNVQERELTQRILQYIVGQGGPTTILQRAPEGHDRTSSSSSCRRCRSIPTTGEEEDRSRTTTTPIPDVPQPSRRPTSQGWDYFTLLTPSDPRWRKHQHTHACTLCADPCWSVALSHRPSRKPGFVTYQITPLNRHLRKFHPDLPYCHTLEANALRNRQNKPRKFEDEDVNTVSRNTI